MSASNTNEQPLHDKQFDFVNEFIRTQKLIKENANISLQPTIIKANISQPTTYQKPRDPPKPPPPPSFDYAESDASSDISNHCNDHHVQNVKEKKILNKFKTKHKAKRKKKRSFNKMNKESDGESVSSKTQNKAKKRRKIPQFQCKDCGKHLISKSNLERHVINQHTSNEQKSYGSRRKDRIRQHELDHVSCITKGNMSDKMKDDVLSAIHHCYTNQQINPKELTLFLNTQKKRKCMVIRFLSKDVLQHSDNWWTFGLSQTYSVFEFEGKIWTFIFFK